MSCRGEANENERRWDDRKIDLLNKDSANNYDATRMRLNFEIGPDGKIHPLGYMDKRLDERLQERLDELGYHPFKADSKIQPNICAKIIIGGNHERTLEMAFGKQEVDLEKGADNSSLHRCREVEDWAMDSYRWCCEQFGSENVIGFQVHLDEKSPHCHALVVPVGRKGKAKSERVMWSAKFGKDGNGYKAALHAMHTSLYETVSRKYGLERGDSIEGRDVRHLDKHEFYSEQLKLQKAIKGLTTMKENLEKSIARAQDEISTVRHQLSEQKITLDEAESKVRGLEGEISALQKKLTEKSCTLEEKRQEYDSLMDKVDKMRKIFTPFKSHRVGFTAPQITELPPTFGRDQWLERQNRLLKAYFDKTVDEIESLYRAEAEEQVRIDRENCLVDYSDYQQCIDENQQLRLSIKELNHENEYRKVMVSGFLDILCSPELQKKLFSIAEALFIGQPIEVAAGGGGDTSDMRWDGRDPDEDEEAYWLRCIATASSLMIGRNRRKEYNRQKGYKR